MIARAAPKIVQTAVVRKKAQIPKKRAAPTPRGVPADIKPKLEPESPIQEKVARKTKPKLAVKPKAGVVQPKTEPDLEAEAASSSVHSSSIQHAGSRNVAEEDIKPDVRALESLLDGLNLERYVMLHLRDLTLTTETQGGRCCGGTQLPDVTLRWARYSRLPSAILSTLYPL